MSIWKSSENRPLNWLPIRNTPWFRYDIDYFVFPNNTTYKNCPELYDFYTKDISVQIVNALQEFSLYNEKNNVGIPDSIYKVEIK